MNRNNLITYASGFVTFLVVAVFFIFSILAPFHQIFPEVDVYDIKIMGYFIAGIFLIDLLFKLFLLTDERMKVEFLPENDFTDYLKSYFIFDLIAIIPISIFPNPSLWQLLPLIKIFSIFKKITFIRQTILKFTSGGVVLQFLFWFVQVTHWISCGWLKITGITEHNSVATNYISALYWTTTTLTTVGYGDIVPSTNIEKLYASTVMIIGVGFYGYLIGNVVSAITKHDPAHEKFIDNLDNLSAIVKHRNLPKNLASRIHQYFLYIWKHRLGTNEEEFLKKLPDGLKLEVLTFLKKDMIENIVLFKHASKEFITEFADNLHELVITPDEYLFNEGNIGTRIFFVVKGELSVLVDDNKKEIAKIYSGDFFGEIALFKNKPRNASVKAITFCYLYYLDKDTFDNLIPKYPAIAERIKQKVLEREQTIANIDIPNNSE